jgi:hypothetical protein
MMEAVCTFETLAYFIETTWRSIPEGCHLFTSPFSPRSTTVKISALGAQANNPTENGCYIILIYSNVPQRD